MANPYRDDIITLVKSNPHKFTYEEIGNQFNIPEHQVRGIARHNRAIFDLIIKNPRRGIITGESFLKGEAAMRDATEVEHSRIERLLEKNGYRPHWAVSWVHLQDEGIKTTTLLKNPQAEQLEREEKEEFLDRVARTAPKTKKSPVPSKTLAIPTLFDVHIGKHCELIRTGNDYTPDKAVRQILQGLDGQHRDFKHFGVTDVLLPMGNDIVHVDNNGHTSTSGTPQDAYGSVESQMMLAVELYIRLIEDYSKHYNVWLAHVHSNHDRVSGWSVSQIVGAYFRNNKRVRWAKESLDQRHRKYFVFGDNLIMFHHGEGKEEKIVGLIDAEVRLASAQTKRTYVYQGHTHHKQVSKRGINTQNVEKDHSALTVMKPGNGAENRVFVETVRSPSPADDWHARSMYSNLPAIETFIHDAHSQRYRLTHWF